MDDNRGDVAGWFDWSGVKRNVPSRVHGETADHLLGELVRLPGDSNRNSATALTTRTQEPDARAPGEGEVHGAIHRIEAVSSRPDPAYVEHARRTEERSGQFQEALQEALDADVDPAVFYSAALRAAVDDQLCFRDRRYDGRRYRETQKRCAR